MPRPVLEAEPLEFGCTVTLPDGSRVARQCVILFKRDYENIVVWGKVLCLQAGGSDEDCATGPPPAPPKPSF